MTLPQQRLLHAIPPPLRLGHDRQREIIAVAAFVVGLEGVAASRYG